MAAGPHATAIKRHDETRRAETTLRTAIGSHAGLKRGKHAAGRETFDGQQRPAIQHGKEQYAGIDRAPSNAIAIQVAQQHSAGTAIPFGASFLGAGAAHGVAQMVEQGERRIDISDVHRLAIQ